MKRIAENLKALRLENNLLMAELAANLGVNHSTISRWESGRASITDENIIKVVRFFGVSADFLLGLDDLGASIETKAPKTTKTAKVLKVLATVIRK